MKNRFSLPALASGTALLGAALLLSACSTGDSAVQTASLSAGQSGASTTLRTTAQSPSSASSANAGLTPLGEANSAPKTQRVEAPAELLVTGVRVGKHDDFERVVFDLEGTGTPGWFIDYTQDPGQQGSGNSIAYQGTTALNVNIDGTMLPFELGKEDPKIGTVAGQGGFVTQVISAGTFEGRSQFVIGLEGKHPYSVQVLSNPTRLVIDILKGS